MRRLRWIVHAASKQTKNWLNKFTVSGADGETPSKVVFPAYRLGMAVAPACRRRVMHLLVANASRGMVLFLEKDFLLIESPAEARRQLVCVRATESLAIPHASFAWLGLGSPRGKTLRPETTDCCVITPPPRAVWESPVWFGILRGHWAIVLGRNKYP